MKCSPNLKSKFSNPYSSSHRAFTLVELLVSVGIFAMMTALIVVKYGNFNQSVLLTNLAYDVALTIRTAQTYGLSVKVSDPNAATPDFQSGYGVHFDTASSQNQKIVFFADTFNSDGIYTEGANKDTNISTYAIKRGAYISSVCLALRCSYGDPNGGGIIKPGTGIVDISFKRPDPDANICLNSLCKLTYVEISVKGTDGSIRVISVRANGQISVQN